MFELALEVDRQRLIAASRGELPEGYEYDSAEAQIIIACMLLGEADVARFRLRCCTERYWPVDVGTDFSTFLEQSRELLAALRRGDESFQLMLYEQGIETTLRFSRSGRALRIHCAPLVPGGSDPAGAGRDEEVEALALVRMVVAAEARFAECCEQVCPQVLRLPELTEWRDGLAREAAELLRGA